MALSLKCSPSWNWASSENGCSGIPLGKAHSGLRWRPFVAGWGSAGCLRCSRGTSWVVMSGGKSAGTSWREGFQVPRVPVLDRYLLAEMVPAFLVALGVGTTLGLSLGAVAGLVRQVVASGLPLGIALNAAILYVPLFVSQTLPLACMAATLFGLGRLKADNEIMALLIAGVPLWRMLIAPICLSVAAALLKVACNDYLVPLSSARARRMVQEALTTNIQSLRQTEDIAYPEYGKVRSETVLRRIWYARRMKGGSMAGLLLLEVSPSGQVERVVLAENCEWNQGLNVWKFVKSTVLPVSHQALSRLVLQVDCLEMPSKGLAPIKPRWTSSPQEFSRSQFLDHIALLEAAVKSRTWGGDEETRNRRDKAERVRPGVWYELKSQLEATLKMVWNSRDPPQDQLAVTRAKYLFFRRDAAAVSCVVYGLVGATSTLALSSSLLFSSKSGALPFALAFFGAIVYNGFEALSGAAGYACLLPPIVSAWLPIPCGIFLGISICWLMM